MESKQNQTANKKLWLLTKKLWNTPQWGKIVTLILSPLFFWGFFFTVIFDASIRMSRKQCPRCDSDNTKTVKAKSWWTSALRGRYFHELFSRSKDLYVCRSCGFSWEAR